jgi:hypothetical protein
MFQLIPKLLSGSKLKVDLNHHTDNLVTGNVEDFNFAAQRERRKKQRTLFQNTTASTASTDIYCCGGTNWNSACTTPASAPIVTPTSKPYRRAYIVTVTITPKSGQGGPFTFEFDVMATNFEEARQETIEHTANRFRGAFLYLTVRRKHATIHYD